jgi:hypothetical protein
VKARPHLEAELMDGVADGAGAADGSRRTIEDSEETVARHIDLPPTESLELPAGHAHVPVQELSPAAITDRGRPLGRAHDVGEHHGDEYAVRLSGGSRARDELLDLVDQEIHRRLIEGLEQVVVAGKLDLLGAADVLRQVATGLDGDRSISHAMENQGGCLDGGQDLADVDVVVGPHQRRMAPGLAEARSSRPNHSTNAASFRRRGALMGTSAPLLRRRSCERRT